MKSVEGEIMHYISVRKIFSFDSSLFISQLAALINPTFHLTAIVSFSYICIENFITKAIKAMLLMFAFNQDIFRYRNQK